MISLSEKFERSITELAEYCKSHKKNHFDFLNESDVKCFLYEDLVSRQKLDDVKQVSRSKWRISPIHTELRYDLESDQKGKICDLAILDSNEIYFDVNKEKPICVHLKSQIKNSVVIELGYSFGDKSKEAIVAAVKRYCKKFDAGISNRYVVYVDMGDTLKDVDVKKMKKGDVKIAYINRKGDLFKNESFDS